MAIPTRFGSTRPRQSLFDCGSGQFLYSDSVLAPLVDSPNQPTWVSEALLA
jgi:hypothetical protein